MPSPHHFRALQKSTARAIHNTQPLRTFSSSPIRNQSQNFHPTNAQVTHIVFFSFPSQVHVDITIDFYSKVTETAKRDGKSYILEARCGRTEQHEPIRDGGYNLLSVLTFKNDADRAFFVTQDPAHLGLKEMISGNMDKTQMVLDFVSGR